MTPCGPHRVALASYALGVLDEADSAQLEAHLGGCDECVCELADLLPTVNDLAIVDPEAFIRAELAANLEPPARRSPARGHRPHRARLGRRLRVSLAGRQLRLLGWVLAAAAPVVVGLVLVLFPHPSGPDRSDLAGGAGTPSATVSAAPTHVPSDAAPAGRFQATDPATGAHLELTVIDKRWGSHLAMSLSNVQGPLRCRMVVVDMNGRTEVVSSWQVPWDGYGTPTHPAPLELQTDSYLPLAGISRVEVQTVDPSGAGGRLVAVTPH